MTTQPSQGTIEANGLVTSFLVAGDEGAPPLVLLHEGAFGASAQASWGALMPPLAPHYRVVAPDLYGYGGSSKMVQFDVAPYDFRLRQVGALLDALGLQGTRAHFVGNSFGGAMAMRATTLDWFSGRLRSVISFGGTGGPHRTAAGMAELAHFDGTAEDMRRLVRFSNGEFAGAEEQVALRMQGATAGNYRAILAPLMPAPFPAPAVADDYPATLAGTSIPIVAVEGTDDPFVEPGWAHEVTRHAPLGRAVVLEGGHSPNVVDPVGTAQLILDILRENERLLADGGGA